MRVEFERGPGYYRVLVQADPGMARAEMGVVVIATGGGSLVALIHPITVLLSL